jgi:hypothetical protein
VSHRRYLIRLFSGGINNWYGNSPNVETLAKAFNLSDTEHSVYEVGDSEEECLVAAAHSLNNAPKGRPDPTSILRIDPDDVSRFGIAIGGGSPGTSGIPRWDYRHRNIMARSDEIKKLVSFVLGLCQRGIDRARRIEKDLLLRSLNAICNSSANQCPDHIKAIAKWCQGLESSIPTLTQQSISRELERLEFDDEIIRPGALQLCSGDMVGDWYESLRAVRAFYRQHYLPVVVKRLKLN